MANYRRKARQVARRAGINPTLFERQIQQESGFQPHVSSGAGARGIAQFMPATARSLGVNPDNPNDALKGAAQLMARYLKQYGGDWKKALVAYNAGPGAVGGSLPGETQNYIRSILGGRGGRQSTPTGGGGDEGSTKVKLTSDKLVTGASLKFDKKAFQSAQGLYMLGRIQQKHGRGGVLRKLGVIPTSEPVSSDFVKRVPFSAIKRGSLSITHSGGGGGSGGAPASGAKGTATFEGVRVAAWIKPELEYARRHGWKGKVTSGFRSLADQTRIYNSGVRPAAKPGTSNHEGADFPRGAVDVTDAPTLSAILRKKRSPLAWAGSRDPVHFSHPHNGSY
jgi:hypothetical protein